MAVKSKDSRYSVGESWEQTRFVILLLMVVVALVVEIVAAGSTAAVVESWAAEDLFPVFFSSVERAAILVGAKGSGVGAVTLVLAMVITRVLIVAVVGGGL